MKSTKRHKIALLFLLVYVPAAMGVSFFHSHSLAAPADKHQISTKEATAASLAQPDLFCTICKFLSSHTSVCNTDSQVLTDLSTIKADFSSSLLSITRIFVLSDRAPPLQA